ncbi:MAG TPA: hypothetical protein VLG92_00125 [Candidatus Saccharimonadia bacterium]|nr:hypothetical protein [Candidatus Saccharimonadia bacterium]
MVCIYCGNKTQVNNSRHQKRLNRGWRRRECLHCHAIFTTIEETEYSSSLAVRNLNGAKHRPIKPFSRDKLFVSILKAVGHRKTATEDASALTATIVAKLLANAVDAVISPNDIMEYTLETLHRFDTVAAMQYEAYHR